jgi:hypothetical protein
MSDGTARTALYEDLLRRIAAGTRAAQLYAPDHPLVTSNTDGLVDVLRHLHEQLPSVAVGIVGEDFVVADTPMPKVSGSMTDLIKRLKAGSVERIGFERGVTSAELVALMQGLAKLPPGTDAEFAIMRQHTVNGAEILRRTPEMPILAPVVAFEHHLRVDGSGYPAGVSRASLNLATTLCSISDVYDAMRSQRAYQSAHPTDRILAVLQRNDGSQFDQHLVRRFVLLLGIYPPGNLVRLSSGEIAVVLHVHAPARFRPRVRILFDAKGQRLDLPSDRNLWEPVDGDWNRLDSVVAPLDPADYNIDPLPFLDGK